MSDGSKNVIGERIARLRQEMERADLDAYLIYSKDPHQSEYSQPHWDARRWITGFTGSAGMVVLTHSKIGLWTDSRYTIQAGSQIDGAGIELYITGLPNSVDPFKFLQAELEGGDRVGADGQTLSVSEGKKIEEKLEKSGILFDSSHDLIGLVWDGRPKPSSGSVFIHTMRYAGRSRNDKIDDLRKKMKDDKLDEYIVSDLSEVAWLFNIRGYDGVSSYVATAYGLVSNKDKTLFIDSSKLDQDVRDELEKDGICLREYSEIYDCLSNLPFERRIGFDPAKLSCGLRDAITEDCVLRESSSLVADLKSIKNKVELENLREVQVRDSVAVVKFLAWLDGQIGNSPVTEMSASEQLARFREELPDLVGPSFPTISGYGEHGALPHYSVSAESDREIAPEGYYLVDSGSHYYGGTTDVTRTIACGDLTKQMRRDYTLVLIGFVDVSRQIYLGGTTGANIDILARTALWQEKIDFKHSTGHGVGTFLNVHEGPCGIGLKCKCQLKPGMVLTVEPGVYRAGEYGIRLENMVVVEKDGDTEFGEFYRLVAVTLVPFDRRAVVRDMLTKQQVEWLDAYHGKVREILTPHLDEREREWLERMTAPLI